MSTCNSYNPTNFANQAIMATNAPNFLTCPAGQAAWSVSSTDGSNQKLWLCGPNSMNSNQNQQLVNNAIVAVTQQPPNLLPNNPVGRAAAAPAYPNDCYGTFSSSGITGAVEVWGLPSNPNSQ